MSFDATSRHFSTVPTLFLNKMISKQVSLRASLTFPTCDVEAAFSRMSKESAKEVSSISARLVCFVDVVAGKVVCPV